MGNSGRVAIELLVGTESEKMYTESMYHVGKLRTGGMRVPKSELSRRNELMKVQRAGPTWWWQPW